MLDGSDLHVAMLSFVLVHAVFRGFLLGVFLHAVGGGVAHRAGDANGVADVFAEIDGVTLDFPAAARGGGEFIFIATTGFFKTAGEGANFFVSGFLLLLLGRNRENDSGSF